MYETNLTVVGTVITDPVRRVTQSGEEVLSFRIASNVRRLDRHTGEWQDGDTLYASVSCWRRLVDGVLLTLMKGDPVVVVGQARTNEYTTKEGAARADLDIRATAVGPDLARCHVKIDRARSQSERQERTKDSTGTDRADTDRADTHRAEDGRGVGDHSDPHGSLDPEADLDAAGLDADSTRGAAAVA